jgi:hypothetical protein
LVHSKGLPQEFDQRKYRGEVLNNMSINNNTMYVSKPPKFEGKQGSAYVVWSAKFQSWAGSRVSETH